ncbi:MAG TPA: hypothetical protein VLH15_04020 [Dehalococcoidales bacterium]|nr:hypothetical protein [Dehalococcoidales bacterium]
MLQSLQIECQYQWKPACLREQVEYFFPMAISPYMRNQYNGPAVYRWEVFRKDSGDTKIVYIGEAQEMCPKRLYSYLNPGPTQVANRKVNTDFRGYLKEKLNIRLDLLDVVDFKMPGLIMHPGLLKDKYVRRLLAAAQIIEHKNKGYNVIDL